MLPAEVTDESCERINAADGPGCSLSPKFVNQGITADIVVTRSGRRVCSKKRQPRKQWRVQDGVGRSKCVHASI
jgi:hypothetical protein